MDKSKILSDKKTILGIKVNGPVFIASLLSIALLVITSLVVGKPLKNCLE